LGICGVITGLATTLTTVATQPEELPVKLLTGICGFLLTGGILGFCVGTSVSPMKLPQTVAGFHSLVGLAAMTTSVAAYYQKPNLGYSMENISALLGNFIGGVTLTGSLVAFGKLNGNLGSKELNLPGKNFLNLSGLIAVLALGACVCQGGIGSFELDGHTAHWCVALLSCVMGWHLVSSVGGGDMPVCVTVLNSYSGWALAAEGFNMNKPLLACVGAIIGFSGAILTKIMCGAMNRDIGNVLFAWNVVEVQDEYFWTQEGENTYKQCEPKKDSKVTKEQIEDLKKQNPGLKLESLVDSGHLKKLYFWTEEVTKRFAECGLEKAATPNLKVTDEQAAKIKASGKRMDALTTGSKPLMKKFEKKAHKEATAQEVAALLRDAKKVSIVPGYGMAQARAQKPVADLAATLRQNGVDVVFVIHPVAGRMPGQMNVLLAEASVPYDWVKEMDEVNDQMNQMDVTICIGSNDIVNSAAVEQPDCSIGGMPVIEVWESKKVVFMKRSMGGGYADLENPVFFKENTLMFLGSADEKSKELLKAYEEGQ